MIGGFLGALFAALSFAGALVAAISFYQAAQGPDEGRGIWRTMGTAAWFAHVGSILGVIVTLFLLIYTHQYQYHYVWSHSSNELPVHYMISCFWEGQEGSFLLWSFWHAILGSVVYFTAKKWRYIVLSVLASVNLILASMILGVYVPEGYGKVIFVLAVLLPMGYLAYRLAKQGDSTRMRGILHYAGIAVGAIAILLCLTDKAGFYTAGSFGDWLGISGIGYLLTFIFVTLFCLALAVIAIVRLVAGKTRTEWNIDSKELDALFGLAALGVVVMMSGFGTWKIGSSPFLLLRDAFKDAPVFADGKEFIPTNGRGLNSLLQNYWMVIHPPTLFLGFASTAISFSFVIGGLIQRKYTEWIRPAAAWMIFSVAVLGVGIIMGGYWAYETLNFGGYWNWDPVENSSFVPWLIDIAALHGLVAYRKSKSFLGFSMVLVVTTFLMVLYSTFLTRSGILGETSVHTFTDLGLSGQLLVLLFVFLFGIIALFVSRSGELPTARKGVSTTSAEFVVFLGVIALVFSGLVITIFTSMPVFNKIFGTAWAAPADGPFFYYGWTVYFAIGIALLSGIGQFLFWRKIKKVSRWNSVLRPYAIAIGLAIIILFAIALGTDWQFKLDDQLTEIKALADNSPNAFLAIRRYITWGFLVFSDEILLFSSLFMVLANGDILVQLLKRNRKTRSVTGGAIAHVGFGLMLLGIFFSSGYDKILSINNNPDSLAALPVDARVDNVPLEKNLPERIKGYQVTYIGKKEAVAPISDLEIIEEDETSFKVRFEDATGDMFALVLPRDVFSKTGSLDLQTVETFLNEKMKFVNPPHINNRTLFGLKFVPRKHDPVTNQDLLWPEEAFTLYPEAELNPTMGVLAHPSRKIMLDRDIYVHVATASKNDEEAKYQFYQFNMAIGDTVQTGRMKMIFERITSDSTQGTDYELIARAHLKIFTDLRALPFLEATPIYRIDKQNRVSVQEHYLDDLYTSVAFVAVNTATGKVNIQVQERVNPPEDDVVIQVIQKPWINLLWLGTFVLVFGFGMAMVRRIRENRAGRPSKIADQSPEQDA